MKYALNPQGPPPVADKSDEMLSEATKIAELNAETEDEKERYEALLLQKEDLDFACNRLELLFEDFHEEYPELAEMYEKDSEGAEKWRLQMLSEEERKAAELQKL